MVRRFSRRRRADGGTGGRPLIGHSVLTVNNSQMTVLQMLVTKRQPPLTLTHLQ